MQQWGLKNDLKKFSLKFLGLKEDYIKEVDSCLVTPFLQTYDLKHCMFFTSIKGFEIYGFYQCQIHNPSFNVV